MPTAMITIKHLVFVVIALSFLFEMTTEQDQDESDIESRAFKRRPAGDGSDQGFDEPGESERPQKAPPLKPDQIEFTKKWWKQLGEQQNKAGEGQKRKIRKKKPQSFAVASDRAVRPGGDWQFLDSIAATLFPLGDPYTGVPDGIFDLGRYCIDFIIQGIILLVYTTVRWPHKILLKTMLALGAVSHLGTNSMFCLNPVSMVNFVRKSKIVNQKMDELTENTRIWKKRLANSIDRFPSMVNIQKHSCCAYWEWKRKSVSIVPKEARDFVFQWFTGFYKIHEVVYCQMLSMTQFEKWCGDFEFMDMEPSRVLPRSMITLCIELFSKFF